MMSSRNPAVSAAYELYKQHAPNNCPFCDIGDRKCIETSENFVVLKAKFPYQEWDTRQVVEHLMVVPRKHRKNFDELSHGEATELMKFLTRYEKKGFLFTPALRKMLCDQ